MKDMEIRFSDVPYDFSPWLHEKCGNVLMGLCGILQENPGVENSSYFQSALFDALKIYALCCGNLNGICCELVDSLLLKYNIEGYYFLSDLINGTRRSSFMLEIVPDEHEERILELIEENERTNRTEIAQLLACIPHPSHWAKEIENDIEFVHNGEESWEWFYAKHGQDRNTFRATSFNSLLKEDSLIKEVYEYFQSDTYKSAD